MIDLTVHPALNIMRREDICSICERRAATVLLQGAGKVEGYFDEPVVMEICANCLRAKLAELEG